uniref:ATP synthase complex subunit 8 n=1 Tax=Algyroides nigropunctatus TaxID=64414 RepID=A0A8A3WRK7_9SAUR|nr:ATP synthase F0 subunit 8 [Algyroides nigropunctatus]QTA72672.1 ATP synthase F0 subunit 8 [Algyroides nigropunctatus]
MPQLNPAPWLLIFLLVWITLMLMLLKTLNSKPNPTIPTYYKQPSYPHWTWPWY